jgi:hypothetical protein
MENRKVLIIIPVYNGVAEFLGDCLSSLQKISYPRADFEILAIDDVSADHSAEYIAENYPAVKIIKNEKNLGFAGTNNIGMQYAIDHDFTYAFLLNQDTAVDPDFLTAAVALIESDAKIGAVQSKMLLYAHKDQINSLGNEMHFLGFAYAGGYKTPDREMPAREITYPSGGAVLLRVAALKDVGLFNPDFYMYHEDVDLGWRLWLGGWKIWLAPKSVVYHKYEFSRSIKKYFFMERNRYLVVCQNYKTATLLLLLPVACLMDLMLFIYSFLGGWWRQELQVYYYFFQPQNWHKLAAARQQVQKKRRVKDREIVWRFTGLIDYQDITNPILKYIVNPVFNLYWQIVRRIIWW